MNPTIDVLRAAWGHGPALLFVIGVAVAGLSMPIAGTPRNYALSNIALYIVGFLMFLQAKRSIRPLDRGRTSPPRPMTPSNRLLYRIGSLTLFFAAVVTFILYNLGTGDLNNVAPT